MGLRKFSLPAAYVFIALIIPLVNASAKLKEDTFDLRDSWTPLKSDRTDKGVRFDGFNRWMSGVIPLKRALLARQASSSQPSHSAPLSSGSPPPQQKVATEDDIDVPPASASLASDLSNICAPLCPPQLVGDGYCDVQCATALCRFDDGDCNARCAPYCSVSWIGDSYCDVECNVASCSFDGGDCGSTDNASDSCSPSWINDGHCDPSCDTDGHDCDESEFIADAGLELSEAIANIYSIAAGSGQIEGVYDISEVLMPFMDAQYSGILSRLGIYLNMKTIGSLTEAEFATIASTLRAANGRVRNKVDHVLTEAMLNITLEALGETQFFDTVQKSSLGDSDVDFWGLDGIADILKSLSTDSVGQTVSTASEFGGWGNMDDADVSLDSYESEEGGEDPPTVKVYSVYPNILEAIMDTEEQPDLFTFGSPIWDDLADSSTMSDFLIMMNL